MHKKMRVAALLLIGLSSVALAHDGHEHHGTDVHGSPSSHENHGVAKTDDTLAKYQGKDAEFLSKMEHVMTDMHEGMSGVQLTGDKDIDFMKMMIPHHQGAIDMAKVILETTKNKEVENLALAIITEQQNEIAMMQHLIQEKHN